MGVLDSKKIMEIRSRIEKRVVTLPDGTTVPCIGQGTWHMGEKPQEKAKEIKALQLGIELGMKVIDTAEMYGNGASERLVGEAIKGRRDDVFLVSKVYPHNAGLDKISTACENSLKRLGTDYLDLYLLHWRGRIPLEETIEGMERLRKEGKILRWGVSNFDTDDMEELWNTTNGSNCATNQVLYHLGSRGIDFDLLPWHREHHVPIMAYSPLAQGGALRKQLLTDPIVNEIAKKYNVKPLQIALAWTIRTNDVIAIPKAGQEQHVLENAEAAAIELTQEDLKRLDEAFPKPRKKVPLDII
ncbi:aldo/keto reductase [Parageobacillus thermoglucosidasius]|uniref:Aldo/keto reductase n=1 Tax=Geobacillus sp. (strain Y4.1MC1) TaxID=581103 RepID=A0A7U4DM91_GEOS0|nr:aldo/keto reductase [Parageobacillus thermoglucosidasius]MED4904578.1 aldo/keto reductase [Parageobacillus thermoglucosidasius]MED4915791.1 aldo/keto reductase [Parageobacillus thermoglucosidasius]MED4944120.1 aldo/keto reductase [Parageobacillus thermoglucosidasius]MED4983853.1 aldo/keto reductase [Parageobacillus thermoglucosidasius]RDE28540.1 aldo/keto reductase [Parageobacillus thermoglucosidasius]